MTKWNFTTITLITSLKILRINSTAVWTTWFIPIRSSIGWNRQENNWEWIQDKLAKIWLDNDQVVDATEKHYLTVRSSSKTSLTDNIKCVIFKTPVRTSHAYLYTKHLSGITLTGHNVLHHQKWWDTIRWAFWKYLFTNNSLPTHKCPT